MGRPLGDHTVLISQEKPTLAQEERVEEGTGGELRNRCVIFHVKDVAGSFKVRNLRGAATTRFATRTQTA